MPASAASGFSQNTADPGRRGPATSRGCSDVHVRDVHRVDQLEDLVLGHRGGAVLGGEAAARVGVGSWTATTRVVDAAAASCAPW